jgi:EAL domain-containing protein (putative c-di-GMP-specific phosphodiesterase class I)
MGVRFCIDDFGTGYSSLGYLKKFPINTLKIDRSFVQNISTDPDSAAISTAIVQMAHCLKLKVIAEGVETVDQLEFLRSLKCDEIQGFLFSRPLPAEQIASLLREGRMLETFPPPRRGDIAARKVV